MGKELSEAELYKELGALTKDKGRWKESIPYVSSLLTHESIKIQAKALWLLGEMGLLYPQSAQDVVPAIAAFLDSSEPLLRERAVNALGRIGRSDYSMIVTMLGTGNALVTECYNTCFIIEDNGQLFMVDGGGGKKNGIRGFDVLRRQMRSAYDRIQEDAPDKIFTLGGGCDADVPSIVYLSEKYQSDLTVIWLDAHGDLNTPDESASSFFYGMPLRSVMDDQCFGLLGNRCPLSISQIIHIGGRDFDEAESRFIKENGMSAYSVQDIRSDRELIHGMIEGIHSKHIYVHLDLDVLDPRDFPNTPLPVDDGLSSKEVYDILTAASDRLVGLGIYEYAPSGAGNALIEKLIRFGAEL